MCAGMCSRAQRAVSSVAFQRGSSGGRRQLSSASGGGKSARAARDRYVWYGSAQVDQWIALHLQGGVGRLTRTFTWCFGYPAEFELALAHEGR